MNQQPDISNNSSNALSANFPGAQNTSLSERNGGGPGDNNNNNNFYAPDGDIESFDWQRMLGIFKRRKKLVGSIIAVVVVLALLKVFLTPHVYQASADLLINSAKGNNNSSDLAALANLQDITSTRAQDTEVEILRSDMVQKKAISLLPVTMQEAAKFADISILQKGQTDIINVAVRSGDRDLAVRYANAICDAYSLVTQDNNVDQYRKTAIFVGKQKDLFRDKLDKQRQAVRNFKEANNIVDLPTESIARVTRLNDLETQLQQTEAGRVSNEAELKNLRAQTAGMSSGGFTPNAIVTRPIVIQLQGQLTTLETQRLTNLQEYTPNSPEVKTIEDQIAGVRQRLASEAKTEFSSYTKSVNPIKQEALEKISATQADLWAQQARSSALHQNIAQAHQEVLQLPKREYELGQLESDLATYLQTYQSLNDKLQSLQISKATPTVNGRVITPAKESFRVGPQLASSLGLALVLGLMLAAVVAAIVDSLDNKVYTEDDAINATGLPVLTHVPMLTAEGGMQLLSGSSQTSALLEAFRMLRTQLSFISSYGQLKTLVVTSSQPGEGKSIISSNLATALALNGKRVILVDVDLRRPRVHQVFQKSNDKGFTNVIAGLCTIDEALQTTGTEGLRIMSSGPTPPNPPELLDSRPARALIEHLKTLADFVILDCPPALILADAQIAATMADGVLLVVSCQEARRNAVARTCELMAHTGAKMVGMVLNKFPTDQGGYYDYYSYGSSGYNNYLETSAKAVNATSVDAIIK